MDTCVQRPDRSWPFITEDTGTDWNDQKKCRTEHRSSRPCSSSYSCRNEHCRNWQTCIWFHNRARRNPGASELWGIPEERMYFHQQRHLPRYPKWKWDSNRWRYHQRRCVYDFKRIFLWCIPYVHDRWRITGSRTYCPCYKRMRRAWT